MDHSEIKELIDLVDKSELTTFELSIDGVNIRMSKNKVDSRSYNENINTSTDTITPSNSAVTDLEVAGSIKKEFNKESNENESKIINGNLVTSPIVGTFYSSSSPSSPVFVKMGDQVKKGDVLCIIEAMKIMNEIISPYDGVVTRIFANNEELIEYGQNLFEIT